jgi:hypothetical protein
MEEVQSEAGTRKTWLQHGVPDRLHVPARVGHLEERPANR